MYSGVWRTTLLFLVIQSTDALICRSINVRNIPDALKELEGCKVVEGYVKIVLIERSNGTDFEPYSFPELREITEFLMIARVRGLWSLGKLFPNLERIGGEELMVSTNFALIIYEVWNLKEIGLTSLKEITKGNVIFYKNPNLCYVDTVDWRLIQKWDVEDNYMAQNYDPAFCPACPEGCQGGSCWSGSQCQVDASEQKDCHRLCVGGCWEPGPRGCYTCQGVLDQDGSCVDHCPQHTYQFLDRRCITREECITTPLYVYGENGEISIEDSYITFEDKCVMDCPLGYEKTPSKTECQPCKDGKCQNLCPGAYIRSLEDAQALTGCTYVNGSIEISVQSKNPRTISSELEAYLGSIEEITGHLKVFRSSVTDLNFLKNLTVIHCNDPKERNAMLVLENQYLQTLWDWNVKKNLSVLQGRLFFHYNPKLCLEQIDSLLKLIHYEKNVSNFEIGKESNGDKFPCHATLIENIKVTYKSFNMFQIHVPYFKINSNVGVLQFVLYYTPDPHKNISMYDDLDQCSDYGWRTKDVSIDPNDDLFINQGFVVNVTDLIPFTRYAFYVTTYTINRMGARSSMNHETTLPSTPSELNLLQGFSNSSGTVILQWQPPTYINGKLKEYVVTWFGLEEDVSLTSLRNYCDNPLAVFDSTPEMQIATTSRTDSTDGNDDCCGIRSQPSEIPNEHFDNLCGRSRSTGKEKAMPCVSKFHAHIHNSAVQNTFKNRSETTSTSTSNSIKNSDYEKRKAKLSFQNIPLNPTPKTKIKQSIIRLPPDSLGTTITGLKHFRDYVISVTACRATDPDETDKSKSSKCSVREIITVRTLQDKEADAILGPISYEVIKGTLSIFWSAPENPNGLIVAFEIQYQTRSVKNPKLTTNCVTYSEYEKNQHCHSITRLSSGEYEFRIRAVSLSGEGPYTQFIHFRVKDETFFLTEKFFICLCLLFTTVIMVFIISHFLRVKTYNNNVIFADVNPNYQYVADHFEVGRENIETIRELGVGSFGKVYEGILRPQNIHCAIKTIFDNATEENEQEFLREATVMKSMVGAYHIVKLLGVVSKGRPSLIIMELMELGDLKSYLRALREVRPLSNATIIKMALEISDAMAYMEGLKFVHRDLAARNCLVKEDLTIKVGDFGMSRDIYETDYYIKVNKGFLPIRWMAPESLKDGEFTSQSDVWSYGVVLWEIVTMAEQPYQGLSNDRVLHEVIAGKTLDIPINCPLPLRSVMQSCWKSQKSCRPNFMRILGSLEYYHDEDFKRIAYFYTREAETIRKSMWEYVEMEPLVDPLLDV